MPRVNRTLVLVSSLASSCAFSLFQLYYYRNYVSQQTGLVLSNPAGHVTSSQVQWSTSKKFSALAQSFRSPSFLADTAALSSLSQDALRQRERMRREPHCSFSCAGRPITSFASSASQWKLTPGFLLAAEQKGFESSEVRGRDPRLAGSDTLSGEEIPSHFSFRLHGHVIQVVLSYERSGNFSWHGVSRSKPDMDRSFAPFTSSDYGRHAGAYDRPESILTVVDSSDVRVPRNVSGFLAQRRQARFSECRHRDARSFSQRYPEDVSAAAVEFRRKVKTSSSSAARTSAASDVPFWISSGTCSGWFRQCGVISYSRDVDVGIFITDFRPDMVAAFRGAGSTLKHKFGKVEDSSELSFSGEDVKSDIFFFYRDGDVVWNGGTQAKSGRKFKYVFPSFSSCWAELSEVKVRVPCETSDYVMANYGATWSVPSRSWDWKTSPSNVMENGVWPIAEWAGLIQVY